MRPKIAPAPMEDINNLHADESFAAPPSHSASRGPSPQPVDCPALSALHTASGAPSHRFTLKHLRHAVTAANVLAQRLEIQIQKDKKKDFHLMLLREELVELKRNPRRCPGPTPAQRQEAWEKEKAHKARLERLQKAAEKRNKQRAKERLFATELTRALCDHQKKEEAEQWHRFRQEMQTPAMKKWNLVFHERACAYAAAQGRGVKLADYQLISREAAAAARARLAAARQQAAITDQAEQAPTSYEPGVAPSMMDADEH